MSLWEDIFNRMGGSMTIESMVKSISKNIGTNAQSVPDELVKLVQNETTKFLDDLSEDALGLGVNYIKALIFAEAIQLVKLGDILSDEELRDLSTDELLRRETLLAVQAQQMKLVAAAEAEKQVAALVVRNAVKAFLNTILEKAGQIGIGILTTSLV